MSRSMLRGPRVTAGILVLLCLALGARVWAVDATPPMPTPQLQQRYLGLTHELRCMQCQDESLADSEVNLAGQMRAEVHDLLLQGLTDQQVRDYLVSRYGEFILFRPPMNWRNAWLWGAPALLMIIGLIVGWRVIVSRRSQVDEDPDDPSDDLTNETWRA